MKWVIAVGLNVEKLSSFSILRQPDVTKVGDFIDIGGKIPRELRVAFIFDDKVQALFHSLDLWGFETRREVVSGIDKGFREALRIREIWLSKMTSNQATDA